MNSDTAKQQQAVRERFTRQASHWATLQVTDDLRAILERIEVSPKDRVLDVAAGSALLGRALASRVREIVAVDITSAMLEKARDAAQREGISNIRFVESPAESLPFEDGEFDLVVTRFSLHHIAEPQRVVNEMVRVARGRGRIAIIDLIASEDANLARRSNEVERRRDPSHATTLSWSQLQSLVRDASATIVDAFTQDRTRDLDEWIDLAGSDARDELQATFENELRGGEPSGLRPFVEDGRIKLHHPLGVVVAKA